MTSTRHRLPIAAATLAFLCLCARPLAAQDDAPTHVYPLLKPPRAADVTGFSDEVQYGYHPTYGIWANLQKKRALEFLSKGKALAQNKDNAKMAFFLAELTPPDAMMKMPAAADAKLQGGEVDAEGVLVAKPGKIFFWKLWNDRVLRLWDASGAACLLVLGRDAGTSAAYLEPMDNYKERIFPTAPISSDAMPQIQAGDVVTFVNRPQDQDWDEIRYLIPKERIFNFINYGTPDKWPGWSPPPDDGTYKHASQLLLQPKDLNAMTKGTLDEAAAEGDDETQHVMADGILAMRDGRIIFWWLENDFALYLIDDQRRACVLRLGPARYHDATPGRSLFVVDGKIYESIISPQTVRLGPDWTPGQPPPLGTEKAVAIAMGELAKITGGKDLPAWRVSGIETEPATPPSSEKWTSLKWYYIVTLTKPSDPEDKSLLRMKVPAPSLGDAVVYVTMDGTPGKITHVWAGE